MALVLVAPGSASAARVVPCSSGAERVVLTASARLDPSCAYTGGIDITASNVTLDCRGAVIDGTGRDGTGILVHAPVDADLSRVTIRNCVVRGFLNSIRVTRDGFRALPAGHEYDHGVRGVVIERTRVSGSRGVGPLRGRIRDRHHDPGLHRDRSGSSGIYLEAGSARNVIVGNAIRDNGFRENGPGGSLFNFSGAAVPVLGDRSRGHLHRRLTSQPGERQHLLGQLGRRRVPLHQLRGVRAQQARSAGSSAATGRTTTSSWPTPSRAGSTACGWARAWARTFCRWAAATPRTRPATRSTGPRATPSRPTASAT